MVNMKAKLRYSHFIGSLGCGTNDSHWVGFSPQYFLFFIRQRKKLISVYWACLIATFKQCTEPWRSFRGQVHQVQTRSAGGSLPTHTAVLLGSQHNVPGDLTDSEQSLQGEIAPWFLGDGPSPTSKATNRAIKLLLASQQPTIVS